MLTKHIQRVGTSTRVLAIKTAQEMRDYARAHTFNALQTLVDLHQDETTPAAVRRAAANDLLDRGWGRPSQSIIFDTPDESKIIDMLEEAEYTTNIAMDAPLQIEEKESQTNADKST